MFTHRTPKWDDVAVMRDKFLARSIIVKAYYSFRQHTNVVLHRAVVGNYRVADRCRFVRSLLPVRMRFQNKCFKIKTVFVSLFVRRTGAARNIKREGRQFFSLNILSWIICCVCLSWSIEGSLFNEMAVHYGKWSTQQHHFIFSSTGSTFE